MAMTIDEQNPIVVTGTSASSGAIMSVGNFNITRLTWLTPTTQGHKLALQDGTGREIHEFYCDNDNETLSIPFDPPDKAINGIYCDDMDSGTLYIYHT